MSYGVQFSEAYFTNKYFAEVEDIFQLDAAFVIATKDVLTDREVSGDVKLEWMINLDCAYEQFIERQGFVPE